MTSGGIGRRLARAGSVAGWVYLLACRAFAADTQWWTSNSQADHAKSESRGVLVDADGVLRPGPSVQAFATDSLGIAWCAVALKDGSVAVGGDRGRVLRWSEKGGWRVWARLDGGQVLALAADGDGAVAGTGPRGMVYRIAASGDTTRVAATGERYVWGLVPAGAPGKAGSGAWYAATGTRGRILRLAQGKTSILLDTEESNLVCMIADGKGGVLAGGDSRGRIYHVTADGTASTLFDAGEDEVRSLALAPDGAVWAAGLSVSAASDEGGGPPGGPGGGDEGPVPTRGAVTGGRAVIYRVTPEGDGSPWWTSPQPLVFALAADAGGGAPGAAGSGKTGSGQTAGVLAATGNRAGVYRIDRANAATMLLSPPQAQVTALVAAAGGVRYAVTSNPVVLWRLGPGRADGGELLSGVLDAKRFARFGRVRSVGAGTRTFSTRSGNTDTPDTTWSRWQAVAGDGAIASPSGRCLQWKLKLGSGDARVDEVTVSWRETNQPPRIDDLQVSPQGQGFREGEMSQRTEAVTQTLSGGQKVEYSATIGGAKPVREMPIWARGLRTLSWRGVDPNGDALRYAVAVRADPDGEWIEIGKDLEASVLTWNTNTLGDGRYRVRVTASDAEGNAVGEGLTAEAVSEPFSIDNTPPRVTSLEGVARASGVEITGAAEDGEGWLQRLDLAIDDGAWHSLTPEGGLSDSPHLTFRTVLKDLGPGPHLLSVRAVDAAGNAATRAVRVSVATRK